MSWFLRRRRSSPLPGFGLALGWTVAWLSLIVLVPLATLVWKSTDLGWARFWDLATSPRAVASYKLTFGASLVAALINVAFGTIVAWVLVRYRFVGRGVLDALVDIPFALPTAVSGLALTAVLAPKGWVGGVLDDHGLRVVFTKYGITIALVFIGLPFVVRTVQPVLEELEPEIEEAAAVLGASRWQTITRVILPSIAPSVITGFALAFARAVGEYGSVVFIAGNRPMQTEITPLLIMTRLENYDYAGATALALVMLLVSFALLLAINVLQGWSRRRGTEV
ncbi:MAG TPA: sulfate ABC transporter permease subunit CysT [Kofleriaceae bacterium]|nr:sulfate ABC transporter permease subunit CysT [Kofleriaceae bacterium]